MNSNAWSRIFFAAGWMFVAPGFPWLTGCGDPAPGEGMEKPLAEKPMPEVVPGPVAVGTPDITTIDPAAMDQAEIRKVVPPGPRCSFAYTAASPPVLVGGVAARKASIAGVVKLHGRLVELTAQHAKTVDELGAGAIFTTQGITLTVKPDREEDAEVGESQHRWPADLLFELDQGLHVGYRGWYTCTK